MTLTFAQQRVLGALMEKESATPEAYPLSLNALVNACNQRSSRDPVLDLTGDQVHDALQTLQEHGLTSATRDARVPKYEHHARTVFQLRRDETAILCLLLLRGSQTPGELRVRADRLHTFDDLAMVQSALDRLARRPEPENPSSTAGEGPLVVMLPRQPGSREARYAHLLGDAPAQTAPLASASIPLSEATEPLAGRVLTLERELAQLKEQVQALQLDLHSARTP